MPIRRTSASPLWRMLSAMRVKSPFSHSIWFGFGFVVAFVIGSAPGRGGDPCRSGPTLGAARRLGKPLGVDSRSTSRTHSVGALPDEGETREAALAAQHVHGVEETLEPVELGFALEADQRRAPRLPRGPPARRG